MKTEAEYEAEWDKKEAKMEELRLKLKILREFRQIAAQTREKIGDD